MEQAAFNAALLLAIVSIVGLILCRKTQLQLGDAALCVLGYFWLIKLGLTLFLLYAGWIPQLDPSTSSTWGYDPQRYYTQAQELIDYNWSTDFVSLNYVGILYYYGVIYYVIGHNPVIPALVNTFVTLIACLYLVKTGYEIKKPRESGDYTLALVLLLPEMVWYDVMTSRETLLAALLLITMLTVGRYLQKTVKISLIKIIIVVGLLLSVIIVVRTSMALPALISILLMILMIKQRQKRIAQKSIIIGSVIVIFLLGPLFSYTYFGGYQFNLDQTLETMVSAEKNVATTGDMGWSENSIGMLLMPEGFLQSILFFIPRMILYLVAPLPNILVPISELVNGSWSAWQKLFTLFSSVINVLAMPYVLASLSQSLKERKRNTAPLIFHIPYWITFFTIAAGNLVIHERYRVMASLLLWGCAWLGLQTCPKSLIKKMALIWYGLLGSGAFFYIGYKII